MKTTLKNRIQTLQALVRGSAALASNLPVCKTLLDEFDEAKGALRLAAHRRYLLQVLHATRALDGSLKAFNTYHGILGTNSHSLGQYLWDLNRHGKAGLGALARLRVQTFQKNIVTERNRYMHVPGQYPQSKDEILTLLGEMDACLAEVLAL